MWTVWRREESPLDEEEDSFMESRVNDSIDEGKWVQSPDCGRRWDGKEERFDSDGNECES